MDYSLLVGIHDPSMPHGTEVEEYEEEDSEYEDGQSYCISSDELEVPQSPSSTTGEFCFYVHVILKRPEWLGRVIVESMLKLKYTSQILTDVEVTKVIQCFNINTYVFIRDKEN